MSELPHVTVFTDGACSGNPGPGGWGAILKFGDKEKELKGGEAHTTNNRMELMAAISALEALKKPCVVDLTTDSQYVRQGITGWIHGWKKNGWRTSDKKPVKNVDLWQRLDAALKPHQVRWHWIKGHAGHDENERADQLAREGVAMARLKTAVIARGRFPSPRRSGERERGVRIARQAGRGVVSAERDTLIAARSFVRATFSHKGRRKKHAARAMSAYSCPSSVSPPETSTLPGAGSRLSFFTTPSSTSIE